MVTWHKHGARWIVDSPLLSKDSSARVYILSYYSFLNSVVLNSLYGRCNKSGGNVQQIRGRFATNQGAVCNRLGGNVQQIRGQMQQIRGQRVAGGRRQCNRLGGNAELGDIC
jgi:hypothetical protein